MQVRIPGAVKRVYGRWSARFGSAEWAIIFFLLAVVLCCVGNLIFGESPWTDQVRELLEKGEKLAIRQRIAIGLHYGIWFTMGAALFLLLLTPWWAVKREMPPSDQLPPGHKVPAAVFYSVLLVAVGVAAYFRIPMLDHSFWNDEELAFRKFNWGEYRVGEDEELTFKAVPWDYAFFYNISGNNHVAQTVLSKWTHEMWMATQPETEFPTFNEAAVRVIPMIFGLLTILAFALALRSVGLGVAGLIVAWLLTFHPWHVEYSVEARGYSGMLFFIVLSFWMLGKALQTPRWLWWLLFGAFQTLYLLHFAGAIYLAAATNLVVLAVLIQRRGFFGMRRWFVASVLSVMGFVVIMAPSLVAIFNYMTEKGSSEEGISLTWLMDLWTHISLGMALHGTDAELAWGVGGADMAEKFPFFEVVWEWIVPAFVLFVVIGACLRLRFLTVFFASLILSAAFAIGHSLWNKTVLMEWYMIYLILGVVLAFGLVGEFVYRVIREPERRAVRMGATVSVSLLILFVYAGATRPQRNAIRLHDLEPMRQAVALVRGEAPALLDKQKDLLTASVGPGADQLKSYDPRVYSCRDLGQLLEVEALAEKSGKRLAIYCCGPKVLKKRDGQLFAEVTQSGKFVQKATLKAVDDFWGFQIFEMKRP